MCGIVGYAGRRPSLEILLAGLRRLEYRGYDSAGVALISDSGQLVSAKKSGRLAMLEAQLLEHPLADGSTGIAHTRWATHGGPSDVNAHPHFGDNGKLALIHNGIIENFAELRAELLADGYRFESETDTEVAAVLIGREYRRLAAQGRNNSDPGANSSIPPDGSRLRDAFLAAVGRFEGAFTLLGVHEDEPGVVVGARRNSPLVIGLGEGENFLGSDVAAFVEHTRRAVAIGQDQLVTLRADSVDVVDFSGAPVEVEAFQVQWDVSAAEKGGWSSFMAKEIADEPSAVADTLRGRINGDDVVLSELSAVTEASDAALGDEALRAIDRVLIVACGTAFYAGQIGAYAIENWTRIPVDVQLSHEFRYREPALSPNTLLVSISQSGETMDTLMAVKYARSRGIRAMSVCNTLGATIPRESDAALYTHAGPEVAVASTKAFTAQLVALYLFGLHLARVRGTLSAAERAELVYELGAIPEKIETTLMLHPRIAELAHWMADTRAVLFLGRHVGYPLALEGALKLKELAYIHAEGFAAGELKHGPIALIEPGQPVFVIVPSPRRSPQLHRKIVSNIQEIRARGARVIAIAEAGDAAVLPFADEVLPVPPASPFMEPMLAAVPLHLFALELASAKGLDVDQPRNLAKSVTVE